MKTSSSYLELLFENRNKEYGAYELRTHYNDRLLKAFGMALLVGAFAFLVPFMLSRIFSKQIPPVVYGDPLPEIFNPALFEKPVKPLVIPPANRVAEGSFRVVTHVEPIAKKKPEQVDAPVASTGDATTPADNASAGGGTIAILAPETLPVETVINAASADVAPVFPGGEKGLMEYLKKNIRYNRDAVEENINGKVFVSFIINEAGDVNTVSILRSLDARCDNEVIRVVRLMPNWTPGIYHGKPVKVAFVLPVSFNVIK